MMIYSSIYKTEMNNKEMMKKYYSSKRKSGTVFTKDKILFLKAYCFELCQKKTIFDNSTDLSFKVSN